MTTTTQAWQGQTRRETIIAELLDRYPDLIDTDSGTGNGDGVIGTPPTYTASVRLVEQALAELHSFAPVQWWHVHERYIRSERVRREVGRIKGRWIGLAPNEAIVAQPGGWTLALTDQRQPRNSDGTPKPEWVSVVVVTWNEHVRAEKVRRGVSWIAGRFDTYGCEPYVPQQVFQDAA